MDLRKLQRVIVDALDDIKAQDIQVFNTIGQTELFDRVIIATASSNRQTRSLAAHVRDKVKAAGGHVVSVEGEESGEWVLVDLGDAVVHIMQPAIRAYYRLEELWGAKPVSLKTGPEKKPAAPAAGRKRAASSPAPRAGAARRAAPASAASAASAGSAASAAPAAPASASPRSPRARTAAAATGKPGVQAARPTKPRAAKRTRST
jgi:ribosome-associated protein